MLKDLLERFSLLYLRNTIFVHNIRNHYSSQWLWEQDKQNYVSTEF